MTNVVKIYWTYDGHVNHTQWKGSFRAESISSRHRCRGLYGMYHKGIKIDVSNLKFGWDIFHRICLMTNSEEIQNTWIVMISFHFITNAIIQYVAIDMNICFWSLRMNMFIPDCLHLREKCGLIELLPCADIKRSLINGIVGSTSFWTRISLRPELV